MRKTILMRAILFTLIFTPIFGYMLRTGFGTYAIKVRKFESSIVGLKRVVTLYDMNGDTIRKWEGRFKVMEKEGICTFIHDGKVIKISGTYSIEEIDSPFLDESTKEKTKKLWSYIKRTCIYIKTKTSKLFTEMGAIGKEWYGKIQR